MEMTLGQLIELLKEQDQDKKVRYGFGNPHSWRGSYDELAFEPVENTSVGEMLSQALAAEDNIYEGWKGGEFKMTSSTTVNIEYKGSYTGGTCMINLLLKNMLAS